MGWSIGYDDHWRRDVGYGVPATCDHPGCNEKIHRGLSYVCGGEPYGGDHGCGLYFCDEHLGYTGDIPHEVCERCSEGADPFLPKPDHQKWLRFKATHASWAKWRRLQLRAAARGDQAWLSRPRNRRRFWELYVRGCYAKT